jgi:hypothetical protein
VRGRFFQVAFLHELQNSDFGIWLLWGYFVCLNGILGFENCQYRRALMIGRVFFAVGGKPGNRWGVRIRGSGIEKRLIFPGGVWPTGSPGLWGQCTHNCRIGIFWMGGPESWDSCLVKRSSHGSAASQLSLVIGLIDRAAQDICSPEKPVFQSTQRKFFRNRAGNFSGQ